MTNIKIKSIIKSQNKNLKKKKEREGDPKEDYPNISQNFNLHQKLEFSNQIQLRKHKQVEGSCILLFMAFTIYYASR